jgi:hypothetical protein
LSLHHRVLTGSGAHPASSPVGSRGPFPGGKATEAKLTTHLYLVPRLRKRGAIPPLPKYAFMAGCSVKKSTGTTLICHRVQTGSGAYPVSYQMSTGNSYSGRCEAVGAWSLEHTSV